ncbi:hypothetical protein [Sulfurimonas sp.]|uniref:hypothetical protein n=1 Tax=Sulfurimonas sp. TaxID=2022749 RepID=UPI002609BF95|nr:hypothetical protein [Sulfurimonas sp.]
MNRVNPLHIIILLIVLLAFVMLKLNAAKEELVDTKSSYNQTVVLADKIKGLKSSYFNKTKVQRTINKILRSSILRASNITEKVTNSSILLTSKNMNIRSLNFLLGKILNGNYIVSELQIKQLSDKKASLQLEIKW